jgi:hypothetical protein
MEKLMNITFEFATTDDCLDKMVPSDLRKLVSERDTALQRLHVIEQAAKALLAELSQHQVCTSCGCGAEEPEAVALKAAEIASSLLRQRRLNWDY